ncbi:MAG: class I SAM-dependent methyltransferase [Burkholderiaceae bacterium]|nr:class I SAM-dependent methyltransferase [Sulfuritalea sp.]MCF8175091.1 class I SAM-dependent methyltransferase [Burkholderiaceae bacterium]MCF8184962.1 class I SAM-dependent methyltransferase [Polynucleobacter sp.]
MSKPLDWTTVSDDPNNPAAKAAVRAWLKTAQQVHTDIDLLGHIERLVRGKRVLDIGVVSHSARYFDLPDWRHGRIHKAASYCVGIDILAPLVDELNSRGFNVRCVDATSEADMGERFDLVFIGDVVEHVDNAVLLLKFAARHLAPGGRLFVTTPNPFSRKFFRQFRRDGVMVVNLDHIAWITPTLAMELARRAGIALSAYHLVKRFTQLALAVKRIIGWRLEPVEFSFPDYLYEFVRKE